MLDDFQLLNRITNFWGLGRFESDYWFVGMEEGGGNSLEEVSKRMQSWIDQGATELVDNYDYHKGITGFDLMRFFEGKIKLQPTWSRLIRTFLVYQNPNTKYEPNDIRFFQSEKWGREDSDNCVIEIFPLASPSANHWKYNLWSDLPILKDRETYKNTIREMRINSLKNKIDIHKPKFVLMYGMNKDYLDIWSEVSGISFNPSTQITIFRDKFIHYSFNKGVAYFVTFQPNAVWSNTYWEGVGLQMNKLLGGK